MNILLGVSASIAIYKSCEIIRLLKKRGDSVQVVLTPEAAGWISPVVWETLSGEPAFVNENDHNNSMAHINLRENRDLLLIAPATANTIAKAANGIADNLLSTLILAFSGRKVVAPSMNPEMYKNPAVQSNLLKLKEWNYEIIDPQAGEAVCGDTGEGRMADIEVIIQKIDLLKK